MRKYLFQFFALLCLLAVQGYSQIGLQPPAVHNVSVSGSPGGTATASIRGFAAKGIGDLAYLSILFGDPNNTANSCGVFLINRTSVYLLDEAGTGWAASMPLGSNQTIQNGKCSLNGLDAYITNVTAYGLDFNFKAQFKSPFNGVRTVWGYSADANWQSGADQFGNPGGWRSWGTFNVVASAPVLPTITLVSPGSGGSGNPQTFTFRTDYHGATGGSSQFGLTATNTFNGTAGVWFLANQDGTAFYLLNDAGTGWMGLDGNGSASNSQATVYNYGVVYSGTIASYTITIAAKPSFTGSRNMWGYSANASGGSSGGVNFGNWTLPAGGSTATGGTGRMQLDLTTTPRTTIDNLNLQTILVPTDRNPQSSVNLYTANADNPSVLHFGDQFTVVIRNAKPNTQVWMFEVDFQPRPYPEPDDITIYPVLPNNGLLGVTNSAGYLMWNGTVSPTGGSHTLHLSVVNASTPPITTVNFDDGSDTPSLNFIGAITFWAADQYNVPTPPVFQ